MALRAAKGLSQKDIAEKMGVTQSKISKLERSDDNSLNLEDFRGYLSAVDMNLRMFMCPKDWPLMQQVKFFAFSIRSILNQMVESARTSAAVRDAEDKHAELLCNMVNLIVESVKQLPESTIDTQEVIDAALEMSDCDSFCAAGDSPD